MFKELYALTLATPLILKVSADAESGKLTLIAIPTPPTKGDKGGEIEPALTQKLSLTATPEEFEQEFPQCLATYTEKYKSLQEQVETTTAVLDAAKDAQVQKGAKAVAKTTTKTPPTPVVPQSVPAKTGLADDDEDEEGGEKKEAAAAGADEPGLFD